MKVLKTQKCFSGSVRFCEMASLATSTDMKFSTFTPDGPLRGALIWLSGLTCTEENFMVKAGAQRYLADAGLMVICPDTSPRGLALPGEHDSYDFGSGAGFYVNATTDGYRGHYRMYDHIAHEIYALLETEFAMKDKISIFGHSMGGHGALTIGLKEKGKFKSVSAFAPIANPSRCAWGEKAFTGYLGGDRAVWAAHDATELIAGGLIHPRPLLVDQGDADEYMEKQLLPGHLEKACKEAGQKLNLRYQPGYDHSYYFISTFMRDHVDFHAGHLR